MRNDFKCFISPTEFQKEFLCYCDAMGFDSNPEFYIDRPSYNDYLIMYTIYGKLCCFQEGHKVTVEQGEAVFLDLHCPHKYFFENGVSTKIAWVTLNGPPAIQLAEKIKQNTRLPFKFEASELYSHMLSLFKLSDCPNPDIFQQAAYGYSFLLDILKKASIRQKLHQKALAWTPSKKYLANNFTQPSSQYFT